LGAFRVREVTLLAGFLAALLNIMLKKVKAAAALTQRTPYCYQTSMIHVDIWNAGC